MQTLTLLPMPRTLELLEGQLRLTAGRRIVVEGVAPSTVLFSLQRLQAALRSAGGGDWEISATGAGDPQSIGILARIVPEHISHAQGYALTISPQQVLIEAHSPVGLFYAVATLAQILAQSGATLPCLRIRDWPDFDARIVLLDISRDKVPSMETVFALVDLLASWKINQFQLYTEHTFAYQRHPEVWANASPFTGQEIVELDAYCRERYVELVPNQNSFGHLHRWFELDRYRPLAEVTDGFDTPWGFRMEGSFSLCPIDEDSLVLVEELFEELLPHFSSGQVNVNCDETVDLGQGRSAAACEELGKGRVYLDFLLKIHAMVKERGLTMQFWGDVVAEHPELIPELPRDAIALEWGYEADHPFDERCAHYARAGLKFYVCPGTSTWCSLAGRTNNMLENQRNAIRSGLKHGATGMMITDWGDRGHWQMLPASYPGFAAGAAFGWAFEANQSLDLQRALSLHAFQDEAGIMGPLAYNLGNIYQIDPRLSVFNGSLLFWILQAPSSDWPSTTSSTGALDRALFEKTLAAIDAELAPLERARMARPDASLIQDEYRVTARIMRHACQRGIFLLTPEGEERAALAERLAADLQEIIELYQLLWLARNRPGGLKDSVARFEHALRDYQLAAAPTA